MSKASKQAATVAIDLADVRRAGGVRAALAKACEESDSVSCGVIGSSFSTPGPGSGWSVNHGSNDYAGRAFAEGALAYVDLDDGRVKRAEPAEEGVLVALRDIGGCHYTDGDWTDESDVYVECPDEDDAIRYPALAAEMARSVIDYHHALSDVAAWRKLISAVRAAGEAFAEIDADDLPTD